jgi:hypothetical protein
MLTTEQKVRVEITRANRMLTCGDAEPCNHSDDEHDAFDLGIADGELSIAGNPFTEDDLAWAWEEGYSVAAKESGRRN